MLEEDVVTWADIGLAVSINEVVFKSNVQGCLTLTLVNQIIKKIPLFRKGQHFRKAAYLDQVDSCNGQ